jgi:hypothetical protein
MHLVKSQDMSPFFARQIESALKSALGHLAECGACAEIRFNDEAGERIVKRIEAGR